MVHLAAVPSRGRTPLGASSAARSAHATEVERWWVAVPRCGARVLRTRTAPLPAATNLVAAGPLCSDSGCLPAKRHLQVVWWHHGEVRPWILPSNATALLGENDGLSSSSGVCSSSSSDSESFASRASSLASSSCSLLEMWDRSSLDNSSRQNSHSAE